MLCVMHEATPYGHLLINGLPVTDTQLAGLCGVSPDQIAVLLTELGNAGAYSRTAKGVIFSRRMTRDAKKAATAKKNGRSGGNPSLSKHDVISASDNPKDNPEDKGGLKAQRPEGRGQIPESKKEEVQKVLDSSSRRLRPDKAWTAEQKKAAWQGKICNEAQRRLSAADYAAFLEAWANDDPKAIAFANALDRETRSSGRAA